MVGLPALWAAPRPVCAQRAAASPAGKPLPPGTEWIPLISDPRSLSDAWPWSSLRLYSQRPASSSPSAQVQAHAPAGHTQHLQWPAMSWTAASTAFLLTLRGDQVAAGHVLRTAEDGEQGPRCAGRCECAKQGACPVGARAETPEGGQTSDVRAVLG